MADTGHLVERRHGDERHSEESGFFGSVRAGGIGCPDPGRRRVPGINALQMRSRKGGCRPGLAWPVSPPGWPRIAPIPVLNREAGLTACQDSARAGPRDDTTSEGWGSLTGHQRGPGPGHTGLSQAADSAAESAAGMMAARISRHRRRLSPWSPPLSAGLAGARQHARRRSRISGLSWRVPWRRGAHISQFRSRSADRAGSQQTVHNN